MIEILSHNAPMLSLRIVHEGREIQVDVSPVRRVDALLTDSLESCLTRYGIREGLESWVILNKLTIVAFREGRADSGDIPSQFRSRPMTKTEAAEYLNLSAHYNDSRGENRKRALRRELNRLIDSGEIRSQDAHHKKFVFDIRGFPKEKQSEMKL